MKEKINKIILGYLPGFITGLIICGTISVIAATYFPSNDVTYDNKESGLTSTNVQGAIDELYGVCTAEPPVGEQIIEDAGLEKDPYECRYFFTGANPNNYITFNDETAGWRIISVECDGTIKIMRTESIGNQAWDSSNSNNWARPATLNTYLNETYYNELNSTAQSQIVVKDWNIGAVTYNDSNMANTISNENSKKHNGKIALPTISEYVRTNSNVNSCGNLLNAWNATSKQCSSTTWMYTSSINLWWTLSPYDSGFSKVFSIHSDGTFILDTDDTASNVSTAIRPALYLSSEVTLTGSGTQSDPYVVNS